MDPVVGLVGLLLGGGFVFALIAAFKAKPERESISVNTLRGVIDELRSEAQRLRGVVDELEAEVASKNAQIRKQDEQIRKQQRQIEMLLERVETGR